MPRQLLFAVLGAAVLASWPSGFAGQPAAPLPAGAIASYGPPPGKPPYVCGLAFGPDGRWLMVATSDSVVRFWDRTTGKPGWVYKLPPKTLGLGDAALSPDGRTLAVCTSGYESWLYVWDVRKRREKWRRPVTGGGYALVFSQDGKFLAYARAQAVMLVDATTGKTKQILNGHRQWVRSLAFSPDGQRLASGSDDGELRLWATDTGRLVRRIGQGGGNSLSFSPDGKLLVSGQNGRLVMLDPASGHVRREIINSRTGGIFSIAFAPDGKSLAMGSWDGWVRLMEVATGRQRVGLVGHKERVFRVAFSPDGKTVASGDATGQVFLWNALGPPDLHMARGRQLSSQELDDAWKALTDKSGARPFRAICTLVATPEQALPFLATRLAQVKCTTLTGVAQLIADLDSRAFATREHASSELARLGPSVETDLRQALEIHPSAEARRRLQALLDRIDPAHPSAEKLLALRATEVLERIGTPSARKLLHQLAERNPHCLLAEQARAALGRLARQTKD